MGMSEIIALIAISLIICGASAYIIKAKKSGKKCIGCPDSASCSAKKCNGRCQSCSCKCTSQGEENTHKSK